MADRKTIRCAICTRKSSEYARRWATGGSRPNGNSPPRPTASTSIGARSSSTTSRHRLQRVVQSWDTAASTQPGADCSVGTIWGYDREACLLLDVVRVRLTYSDLVVRVRLERKRWQTDLILVENASVGLGLVKDLRHDSNCEGAREHHAPNCNAVAITPHEGKGVRTMAQVERLYEGFAKFPRAALWLDDLRHELLAFPEGRRDDKVDSISQFLRHAINRPGGSYLDDNYRRDTPRPP